MSGEIESELAVLVGLPFWQTRRACDLQVFHFGAKRASVDRKGRPAEFGEYALHVQCAFRFRAGDEILAASRDRYDIIDGGDSWDRPGANLLDVRMKRLLGERCPALVSSVRATPMGDLAVEFGPGLILEVWIDDSGTDEHWRFFKPGDDSSHFVFEAGRLQHE